MKRLLKGVKQFMHEKYETMKDTMLNTTIRFVIGSAAVGFGVAMVASCFMPQFNGG